jgi:hypothetical protein
LFNTPILPPGRTGTGFSSSSVFSVKWLSHDASDLRIVNWDSMHGSTEKQLDKAFEAEIQKSPAFVSWFLSKTKFIGRNAR